jgi:hypothetical protein
MTEEEEYSEKTVEELAREAMAAIKESKRAEEQLEEENAKTKENNLKQEVENKVRSKMKRVKRDMEKAEKSKKPEIDTSFMVHWGNADGKGLKFEGNYNDKYTFRINRGIMLFHLYVEDKKLINESWHHKSHTSINLETLKIKADKILKEFIKKASDAKKAADDNKII